MSWLWLGLLVLAGVVLWIRRRLALRRDAILQAQIDRLGSYSDEPKVPPAKQPWKRPGFGPPARMSRANLGEGPMPPPAGNTEDPSLAGPVPDDEDVPTLIPMDTELEAEPTGMQKPPPPPPPGSSADAPPVPEAADVARPTDAPSGDLLADLPDPEADVELAVVRGPRVLDLPPELADEVRGLMNRHQEVAAVRLVCDSMGVGIIDAQRTVRSLVGR